LLFSFSDYSLASFLKKEVKEVKEREKKKNFNFSCFFSLTLFF